ncbi:MAG: hypothetical protein OEV15_04720 [Gallionella sp.]|nr:hypothetical protein [Gallionella sp.]
MTNTNKFFIGRQSILDRNQNLAGFELLFRSSHKNRAKFQDDDTATCLVINHFFNEPSFKTVLGNYRSFINASKSILMSDMIKLLENVHIDAKGVERCKHLKSIGYMLALDISQVNKAQIEALAKANSIGQEI